MFNQDSYIKLKLNNKFDLKNLETDDVATIYKGLDLVSKLSHNNNQIEISEKLKNVIEHNRQ